MRSYKPKFDKIYKSCCTPRWRCERRFWLSCSIYRAGFVSVTNDGRKSTGCHSRATRMCRTSSRCSFSVHPGQKWRMFQHCWMFPGHNVHIFGYVYHDTNGHNHGPVWKTQSFLLSEICTVILWQDYYGKGNLRKSYWSTVGRRFPILESLFVHREEGLFLSVYVDDIKLAGKKQDIDPMWKVLSKEVDLGEPTSFFDHVYLGLTQRRCEIRKDIVVNFRTIFESRISAVWTEKITMLGKSS